MSRGARVVAGMPIDTDRLRQLATAATPGPWTVGEGHDGIVAHGGVVVYSNSVVACADHAFILAASPDVVLALLDEIDRLRGLIANAWTGAREAEDAKELFDIVEDLARDAKVPK